MNTYLTSGFVCVAILFLASCTLPAPLDVRSILCERRMDGSFSWRRWAREMRYRIRYSFRILFGPVLSFWPLIATALFVHCLIAPIDVGRDAMREVFFDSQDGTNQQAAATLSDRNASSGQQAGNLSDSAQEQQTLRSTALRAWSFVAVCWIVFAPFRIRDSIEEFREAYLSFARELNQRCHEYEEVDWDRLAEIVPDLGARPPLPRRKRPAVARKNRQPKRSMTGLPS